MIFDIFGRWEEFKYLTRHIYYTVVNNPLVKHKSDTNYRKIDEECFKRVACINMVINTVIYYGNKASNENIL